MKQVHTADISGGFYSNTARYRRLCGACYSLLLRMLEVNPVVGVQNFKSLHGQEDTKISLPLAPQVYSAMKCLHQLYTLGWKIRH